MEDPVVCEWLPEDAAERYHLQVSRDASFSSIVFDNDTVSLPSASVPALERWHMYFWRVRACGGIGCSRWSEPWVFRTSVGAPSITQPVPGETFPFDGVRFAWEPVDGAEYYQVQISEFQTFGVIEYEEPDVRDTLYNPSYNFV